jgi:hypothetical protein
MYTMQRQGYCKRVAQGGESTLRVHITESVPQPIPANAPVYPLPSQSGEVLQNGTTATRDKIVGLARQESKFVQRRANETSNEES